MEKEITLQEIQSYEQRYRAAMINSIGGFKSVVLIGTRGKDGNNNLAIFNSLFHLGASPALFGLIIRPDSVDRHTLSNILETGVYTVNHITKEFYFKAHQTAARYPKEVSEFAVAGITPEYRSGFYAPYVKESHIKIGASFRQRLDIQENGTVLIIGKMNSIILPENCIAEDGYIDIEKAGTITCSGLDSYHTTARLNRLPYAKPDKPLEPLNWKYAKD